VRGPPLAAYDRKALDLPLVDRPTKVVSY